MRYYFTEPCFLASDTKRFYTNGEYNEDLELSDLQMQIVLCLCENAPQPLDADEIYNAIPPEEKADHDENSIPNQIRKIREKMNEAHYPLRISSEGTQKKYFIKTIRILDEKGPEEPIDSLMFTPRDLWDAGHHWYEQSIAKQHRFYELQVLDQQEGYTQDNTDQGKPLHELLLPDTTDQKPRDFDIYFSKDKDSNAEEKTPLRDLLKHSDGDDFNRQNLFLIGEGGIGKTYSLMWIMKNSYQKETNRYHPGAPFSIFIELSKAPDYYCKAYGEKINDVPTFIRRSIYRQLLERNTEDSSKHTSDYWNLSEEKAVAPVDHLLDYLENEFQNEENNTRPCLLLLLDGLNEVSTATIAKAKNYTVRQYITEEINHLMKTYPSIKFVLTSRTEHNGFSSTTIVPHWLQGVDDDSILDYLTNPLYGVSLPQAKVDEIFQNKKLMMLLHVPIFLRMFAPLAKDHVHAENLTTRGSILRAFLQEREKIIYTTHSRLYDIHRDQDIPIDDESRKQFFSEEMQHFILQFILPAIANEMEKNEAYQISLNSSHIRGITEILDDILPYTNIADYSDNCKKTYVCGEYGNIVFAYHALDGSGKQYTPFNIARDYLTQMLSAGQNRNEITKHIVDYCVSTLGILCYVDETETNYKFIHQHFRDYFSALFHVNRIELAVYAHKKSDEENARACMKDLEDRFLPQIICEMIGEYLGENLNAPVQDEEGTFTYNVPDDESDRSLIKRVIDLYRGEKPENKPEHYGVVNLFNIVKDVRKDLSGSDFHDLDLRDCSFSYVPLDTCERTDFTESLINATTWFPMGHSKDVIFARFSKDMRKIISFGNDHSCRIWNAQTGICEQIFHGCYNISYSGKLCLTYDIPTNYLRIWDTETGTCKYENNNIITMNEHLTTLLTGISYNEKLVILRCNDSDHCILFNIETGRIDFIRPGNFSDLFSCHFSHNDKYLCFVTEPKRDVQHIHIWDIEHQKVIRKIETEHIDEAAFSYNDKYILSSHSGFIDDTHKYWCKIWNSETGECIHTLPDQEHVKITPNGQYIISNFQDHSNGARYSTSLWKMKSLSLWKMKSFEHIRNIKDACYWELSNNGKYLATSGRFMKTISIQDMETNECIQTLKGHTYAMSLYFSHDNRYLISCYDDRSIRVWDMKTGNCVKVLEGVHLTVWDIHFSNDGKSVLSASFDHTSKIMDVETGICTHLLEGHNVLRAFYSPDENYIATDSFDYSIRIYDAKSGRLLHSFANSNIDFFPEKTVSSPFSPDGEYMVFFRQNTDTRFPDLVIYETKDFSCVAVHKGIRDNYVWATVDEKNILCIIDKYPSYTTWSPETGSHTLSFELPSKSVRNSTGKKVFSADGKYVCCHEPSYGYVINDTMSGKCISTFKNHNRTDINALCFSHNNQLIASGDFDWFRVIDRLNGKCVVESSAPDRGVYHVHFSHDDRLCISVTYIAVYVWDIESKQVLHTLKTPDLSHITDAIFSPDGKTIVSSHEDGRCIIWDIATGKPIKTLYSSASLKIRNVDFTNLDDSSSFTDSQREQFRSMGGIITTT